MWNTLLHVWALAKLELKLMSFSYKAEILLFILTVSMMFIYVSRVPETWCVSYLKWSSSLRAMKAKMKAIRASRMS